MSSSCNEKEKTPNSNSFKIFFRYDDEESDDLDEVTLNKVSTYMALKKDNVYTYEYIKSVLEKSPDKIYRSIDKVDFDLVMFKDELDNPVLTESASNNLWEWDFYPTQDIITLHGPETNNTIKLANKNFTNIEVPVTTSVTPLSTNNNTIFRPSEPLGLNSKNLENASVSVAVEVIQEESAEGVMARGETNVNKCGSKPPIENWTNNSNPKLFVMSKNKAVKPAKTKKSIGKSEAEFHSSKHLVLANPKLASRINARPESPIWKHCTKTTAIIHGESCKAIECNHCKKIYKDCNNTSNLDKHLKSEHMTFYKPTLDEQQELLGKKSNVESSKQSKKRKLDESVRKIDQHFSAQEKKNYQYGGVKNEVITDCIVFMIVNDFMPLDTVEKKGFKILMKLVAPLYEMPSRKEITKRIESHYKKLKDKLIKNLDNLDAYSITADKWSDCSKQSYMGVTVHHLSPDMTLQTRVIGCIPVFDSQTADVINQEFVNIFQEFQIDAKKVAVFVTDGEAAMVNAIERFVGKEKHLICTAHKVSKLIPDTLKKMPVISHIVDKIKKAATFIHHSPLATSRLKELQKKEDVTVLTIIQDVATRWTSTIHMIERYIEIHDCVFLTLAKCKYADVDKITQVDLEILADVLPLMQLVENFINDISGQNYPTASIVIPLVRVLKEEVIRIPLKTEEGNTFKKEFLNNLEKRFNKLEQWPILADSTLLDPRYKKFDMRDGLATNRALRRINSEIISKSQENKKENIPTEDEKKVDEETLNKHVSLFELHEKQKREKKKTFDAEETVGFCPELSQYLNLDLEPAKTNPFIFWRDCKTVFPNLSNLATKKLISLATSVPSERVFSRAGIIKTEQRSKLTPDHVNMLLFLSCLELEEWLQHLLPYINFSPA